MIEITKQEKDYLLAHGCKWHSDIFSSTTRRHYYAKEHPWVMNKVKTFRNRQKGE